jgi:hypothetical protein
MREIAVEALRSECWGTARYTRILLGFSGLDVHRKIAKTTGN